MPNKMINIVMTIAAWSASCTSQTTMSTPKATEHEDLGTVNLGSAFSQSTNTILGNQPNPCLEIPRSSQIIFHKSPVATLASSYTRQFSTQSKMLNINADAGVGLLKAKVEFIDSFYKSDLSAAYITEFSYDHGTYALAEIEPKINQIDPSKCGDAFVDQVDVGARLYIALVINFKERREKQSVAVKLILDLFFGEIPIITAEIARQLADVAATVDLKMLQVGGDLSQFHQKIPNAEVASCGYVSQIDPRNPDPLGTLRRCIEIYGSYIKYARTDFHSQIKNPKFDPNDLGNSNLAQLNIRARTYREAGYWWIQPNFEINQNETLRRQALEDLDETITKYSAASYSLQRIFEDSQRGDQSVFRLKPEELKLAKASLKCVESSLKSLFETKDECTQPGSAAAEHCLKSHSQLRISTIPYFETSARTGATSKMLKTCAEQ